jgi:hypothetical protein
MATSNRSNGRFRDECLNASWFLGLPRARAVIESWRQDYNEVARCATNSKRICWVHCAATALSWENSRSYWIDWRGHVTATATWRQSVLYRDTTPWYFFPPLTAY